MKRIGTYAMLGCLFFFGLAIVASLTNTLPYPLDAAVSLPSVVLLFFGVRRLRDKIGASEL